MTDDQYTFLCLVDGEATPFPVEIESCRTIGQLKDAIKTALSPQFDDVTAKDLALWMVSIPVMPKKERKKISLANVPSKEELDETDDVSDVFEETPPKKTIHIIVQRALQVYATVPSRDLTPLPGSLSDESRLGAPLSATSIPTRSIFYDSVEEELALIIEDANRHHSWHTVDTMDVETAQQEKLGPFYKKPLPYGASADSMNLAMLGAVLDREPTSEDNKALRQIVDSDIKKTTGRSVVAMVGRSGSGKTATVIDLARKHFVVYCVCSSPRSTGQPEFQDRNFSTLAKDVEQMCQALPIPSSLKQRLDNDSRLKRLAGDRVELDFLARLLFLQLLFNGNAELTPEQFFRE
ncbi:hypothetical protein EDD21DRAFT_420035 [Dissophora ornata]|nr:hypothetical protein EDD21DRAFT_420035 [Dissophora ornata]